MVTDVFVLRDNFDLISTNDGLIRLTNEFLSIVISLTFCLNLQNYSLFNKPQTFDLVEL